MAAQVDYPLTNLNGHPVAGTTAMRPTSLSAGELFLDTTTGELLACQSSTNGTLGPTGVANVGAKNGTGVTAAEGKSNIHATTLTLASVTLTTTDNGTNGASGNLKVYDLPSGNIVILGAAGSLTLTGGGGVASNSAVVLSVGSVAAGADATLSSTEANIVPSTAATLSSSAGSCNMLSTGVAVLDGVTSAAADIYLNAAMPDAGSSGDGSLVFSGNLVIDWLNLSANN